MKRWTKFVACNLLGLATSIPVALAQNSSFSPPSDKVTTESLKFTQAYGAIQENFADPVDPDRAVLDGGIRGMLSALDPFCSFFDKDQFDLLKQQTRGEALGFGSILYVTPGKILVLQTAQGSPSWRAGLGPGDEILEINGTRVNQIDFQSLVELLRRSRSHPVRLGVMHPGRYVSQGLRIEAGGSGPAERGQVVLLSPASDTFT